MLLVCTVQTQNPSAYHLASELIRNTVDALEPYVQTVGVPFSTLVCQLSIYCELLVTFAAMQVYCYSMSS